jgi:D-beta-D-heptose 7-phosphate kinase/D-beta-D-heptose 1-phosphate adenosyltransferase
MKNKKVLVIGDSCTDVFRYGTCERLSPEAPVAVMKPSRTTGNGGMAINVHENLKALGVEADIITNDIRPVKTRYVDEVSNQMLLRVDESDEIEPIEYSKLLTIDYTQYDIVVVSDYDKGFLSEDDIEYIGKKHPVVFMDTKKKIGGWCEGIEFIKINEKEFLENSEWLTEHYGGNLIVTLGGRGAKHWFTEIPIEKQQEVRDLSGAGDTFLAALVADYVKNSDICDAIRFANRCAAWVVSQKGVAVVNPDKI